MFGTPSTAHEATEYSSDFKNNYQKDSSGNANGVTTALLSSEGFGTGWNVSSGSTEIPKINGVDYSNSSTTGFFESYGKESGGLFSDASYLP